MMCLVTQTFSLFDVKGGGSPSGARRSLVTGLVEGRACAPIAVEDAPALLVVDYC
jgi:hypothetical protein